MESEEKKLCVLCQKREPIPEEKVCWLCLGIIAENCDVKEDENPLDNWDVQMKIAEHERTLHLKEEEL